MQLVKLTPEQEEVFALVLSMISNERKSVTLHLLDSESYQTGRELMERLREECDDIPDDYLRKSTISGILHHEFTYAGIVDKHTVKARGRDKGAAAFRLKPAYARLRDYAGHALSFAADVLNQSIYPVFGCINSSSDAGVRRHHETVSLLYALAEGPRTLDDLAGNSSYGQNSHLREILERLSGFKDHEGAGQPLVEVHNPIRYAGELGYRWFKGRVPYSRTPKKRWRNMTEELSDNPDRIWTGQELQEKFGYSHLASLTRALKNLIVDGYMEVRPRNRWIDVKLTSYGSALVYGLLEPIKAGIKSHGHNYNPLLTLEPESMQMVLGAYKAVKDIEIGRNKSLAA